MCWQLELTGRQGNGGVALLLAFSEVIKKVWEVAVEKGWEDGRNFAVISAIFSIPGIWRSTPASPTPSSKLHRYWAWPRDVHQ